MSAGKAMRVYQLLAVYQHAFHDCLVVICHSHLSFFHYSIPYSLLPGAVVTIGDHTADVKSYTQFLSPFCWLLSNVQKRQSICYAPFPDSKPLHYLNTPNI